MNDIELCKKHDRCVLPGEKDNGDVKRLGHLDFLKAAATVPFILCPHGGGIDPSPKAWESIFLGTIPIIKMSPYIFDSYSQLPVVFVDSWDEIFNVTDIELTQKLTSWIDELGPYYEEGSDLRQHVLHVS